MIQSLFLILKDISHVLSNQNMNGKWSFPKKGMLGAHGVQRSKNCFQLRAGRGRYGSQRSGNVKVKERLYQAEGCEQRAEAGRFFPGGTVVLPPPGLQPAALCGTPASWLITLPCMGDESLAQLPSVLIKGQS